MSDVTTPYNLTGKVAVVTGGTVGIGRDACIALAKAGAKVVVAGRRQPEGEQTVAMVKDAGGEATFVSCDVTQEDQVKALMDRAVELYGRLDVGFNNAGIEGPFAPTADQSFEDFRRVVDTNLHGTFLCIKYQLTHMLALGNGGAIINNSSIAGVVGYPAIVHYTATKHAIVGMTKTVALEYAEQGIRANCICAALIKTPMFDRATGGDEAIIAQMDAIHPVGRSGTVKEFSDAVLFLAGDTSSFITGHALMLDGGYTAR